MTNEYKNFMNGQWCRSVSGKIFENINPSNTDDVVGNFQYSVEEDIKQAIDAAEIAFEHWNQISITSREVYLYKAADVLQVKAWYVYCDDVPYWRDLMWYPVLMKKKQGNQYEARVGGNQPDAWFVEVKDIANGFPGYVSSLPQDITGKPAEERNARQPRNWELKVLIKSK